MQARTSILASSLAEANRELAQLALHDGTWYAAVSNRPVEDRLEQAINKANVSEAVCPGEC